MGRCRKLRRVDLYGSEVSLSGLVLLAGSKAQLPELESVTAGACTLCGDDNEAWSDVECGARRQPSAEFWVHDTFEASVQWPLRGAAVL
jgi:hypothetical protein